MVEAEKDGGEAQAKRSLVVPCATVFISSFCIMVLELVAGRIIARWLGSSLYTWTSVIGVVLAGITVGNYLGGRIADRFRPAKALAVLFAISSAACVVTIVLNNFTGEWTWLWQFSWPVRIFLHVSLVFLLPSTLLGTISPVAAKMALERGLPTGKTVGDIYAWGAAGSIAGTFAAGYYLIAAMGTVSIIWAVGGAMMLMAVLYGIKSWITRVCALLFVCVLVMGVSPWQWTEKASAKLGLREQRNPAVIYEDETQYCHIMVKNMGGDPERRIFMQDRLIHSEILVGQISNLRYPYEQIMAAVTQRFSKSKEKLSFLIIGGGGYVLPQYLEKLWPTSNIDVVEIDPGVTRAAMNTFGLDPNTTINTISLDARNYVEQMLQQQLDKETRKYDFVYEDALSDYSVPYQLTTREFNDKLSLLLTDDGIYMVEMIEVFDSGLFLGAFVNTLKQTFGFVSVISEHNVKPDDRNTFVVIAAKHKLDLENVCEGFEVNKQIWYLDDAEIAGLIEKSKGMILTDDYAPVDNLLAPVARESAEEALDMRKQLRGRALANQAEQLAWAGRLPEVLAKLDELVLADPTVSVRAHSVMASIFADKGKVKEAIDIYHKAFARYSGEQFKNELLFLRYNFGVMLKEANRLEEAAEQFRIAAEAYDAMPAKGPEAIECYSQLGDVYAQKGDFQEAVRYFQKAVDLKPDDFANNFNLIRATTMAGKLDDAISMTQKVLKLMLDTGRQQEAVQLQEYLRFLDFRKSQTSGGSNPSNK
jgi:tetratricopeptide (TPR) repeat protein/MFS family permease